MNANIILNLRSAARQIRRVTPTKLTCTIAELDGRLGALGCQVDAEGNFNVLDLLRAVRVNVEPFEPPPKVNAAAEERRKFNALARRVFGAAKP